MANYGVMGNIVGDLNDAPVRSNCILLTPTLGILLPQPQYHAPSHGALSRARQK